MARSSVDGLMKLADKLADGLKKLEGTTRYTASYGINFDLKIAEFPKLTSDIQKVADLFKQSLAIELRTALDDAMQSNVWGGNEDSNLVDTGNLRDSLQINVTSNGVTIDYTAEYAALIHYGGYILPYGNPVATRVYLEGRPWIDSVLYGNGPIPAYDFEELFNRSVSSVFG